jgi:hypothetical protein
LTAGLAAMSNHSRVEVILITGMSAAPHKAGEPRL